MVNANSNTTRAPARVGYTLQSFTLDSKHPFFTSNGSAERDRLLTGFKSTFNSLSPATRRMLQAVRAAQLVSYDDQKGYKFAPYVNRAAIARKLERELLVPYDIRILRNLASMKLIVESRRALPRKQYGEIWLGAGAEFIYAIPGETLFCLLAVDPDEKQRLASLVKLTSAREAREAEKAKQLKQKQELERYRSMYGYKDVLKPKKRNLLERIVDLLSW